MAEVGGNGVEVGVVGGVAVGGDGDVDGVGLR